MKTISQSPQARRRLISYLAFGGVLVVMALLTGQLTWRGTGRLHSLAESVTISLGFATGLIALVRYYSKKRSLFLLLGAGSLGAALLDGYHLTVTSTYFIGLGSAPASAMISWSWMASRLFLIFLFGIGWLVWHRQTPEATNPTQERLIYLVVASLLLVTQLFFIASPLPPRIYYPKAALHRPWELVPGALFLLLLIGYLRRGYWAHHHIEHWLIYTLILNTAVHLPAMALSAQLYDAPYFLAHALKFGTYATTLTGLLVSTYDLFQKAESSIQTMQRVNQQLQREVAERKLAEAEAERHAQAAETARAQAEEASRAKSDFLATVSHELRTPLTSVLGFAKIIRKRFDDDLLPAIPNETIRSSPRVRRAIKQISANVHIIEEEGERLTALIAQVLDLARIEAGKVVWKTEPVSIRAVIEQSVAAMDEAFAAKSVQLRTESAPDLPLVPGDYGRLVQVMMNLLSNALKFTAAGSVTCQTEHQDGVVIVRVIDTGIGIAPEDYDKLFETFVQLGNGLTDKVAGTGLGLPICKNIIEHHGGRIWVESEAGVGSTFAFMLPVAPGKTLERFNVPTF